MNKSLETPEDRAAMANIFLWVVSLAILAIILLSAHHIDKSAKAKDELRFEYAVNGIRQQITARIATYIAALRGARGFFSGSEHVNKSEFYTFAHELKLDQEYPGFQGLGYSTLIPASRKKALIERMRNEEEEKGFNIFPASSNSKIHSIIFLYPPDDRNSRALGYDMSTEPVRRAAMELARDTGLPTATGKVTLVQEIDKEKQAGFLIFLPVYLDHETPLTIEERRSKLTGYVYIPFRADNLFNEIFSADLNPRADFEVYDGGDLLHASRIFNRPIPSGYVSRFSKAGNLQVAGRTWDLIFNSRPRFEATAEVNPALAILLAGGAVTIIFVAAVWSRSRSHKSEKKARDELRLSKERLNEIIESSSDAIITKSLDGKILSWNASAERIFEYSAEEIIGKNISTLLPPERQGEEREILAKLMRGERIEHLEMERLTKSGKRIYISVSTSPIRDSNGLIIAAAKIARDITERRRHQDQLRASETRFRTLAEERNRLLEQERAARVEIERTNRIKDEFLLTLSHELRTPLNAILGWSQFVARKQPNPDQLKEGLAVIERNARTQAQIIDDLLDMNRIVSGKIKLEIKKIALSTVLSSAVDTIMPAAGAKDITIEVSCQQSVDEISADPIRLNQVFWNLLSNAVKFTNRGGWIRVMGRNHGPEVEVSIEDNGEGIKAEFLPFVFDRFRQADSSTTRRQGGLGLGLNIVKQLVELHGGRVTAESLGVGKGSLFTVTLPISQSVSNDNHDAVKVPLERFQTVQNGAINLGGRTILVVDDEADARDLFRAVLGDRGATVLTAGSAKEGLAVLKTRSVDVILSDIGMPGEDGYAFIKKVRGLPAEKGGKTPAIAVTAFARREDRVYSIVSGFQLHVSKPVEPAELIAAVGSITAERVSVG